MISLIQTVVNGSEEPQYSAISPSRSFYSLEKTFSFGANSGSRTRTTSFNVGVISNHLNYLYSKSAFFRKGGARTHNLSLAGKRFAQRQLGRMLFLKLLFLLLAASTGIEPVKYAGQSGGPYPLGYEAICWFGYSRPITPSGHASSEGLYISSIVVLLLVLWVLDGDTCCLDIRQTKLSPFNLNIFFVSKRTMFLVFLQFYG